MCCHCFSSVTHTMWWAPCAYLCCGLNLRWLHPVAGPDCCTVWMAESLPPFLPRWMNECRVLVLPDSHGLLMVMVVMLMVVWKPPEEPSQEKIQKCWGWWGGAPDLSQWRHTQGEMYRIYTFFCIPFESVIFLSHIWNKMSRVVL